MISSITTFDLNIAHTLYAVRDMRIVEGLIWLTELGSITTVLGITFAVCVYLAYRKKRHLIAGLLVSVLGSGVVSTVLKTLVARERPFGIGAYVETGFSFPSGHATGAVALYGFLLWMLWDVLPPLQKRFAFGLTFLLILAIGFSRLYLGVHFLSDVLAGYIVGSIFLWVGIKIARSFKTV